MERIINHLAEIRADCQITQKELADATSSSLRTIIYIESGHAPNLLLALRIADYFSLPLERIFTYEKGDITSDNRPRT